MNLTQKQKDFVIYWIEFGNKKKAYEMAYNCDNYKESTIYTNAYQTSNLEHVRAYYDELQEELRNSCKLEFHRVHDRLLRISDLALRDNEYNASTKAITELAKLHGMYGQKIEGTDNTIRIIVADDRPEFNNE